MTKTISRPPSVSPVPVILDGLILKPQLGGIQTYIRELSSRLAVHPGIELTVVTSYPEAIEDAPATVVDAPPATRRWQARAAWRESHLRRLVAAAGDAVVIAPIPELPFRRLRAPTIVVIHDVSQVLAPALYGRASWLRYSISLRHVCSMASAVVCVSETTKGALHMTTGIDPRRCAVIGEGAQGLVPDGAANAPSQFLLYVGSLLKHKNVATLVRALALGIPEDVALVMVGPATGSELTLIRSLARDLGVAPRIHHRGFVTRGQLAALYRDAAAVLCPSLVEGFGLPVLEAMSAGAPVIASDVSALREVGADAVRFVSQPLSPAAWRRAVEQVVGDSGYRADLIRRGRRRAGAFSWDAIGQAFAELVFDVRREAGSGFEAGDKG